MVNFLVSFHSVPLLSFPFLLSLRTLAQKPSSKQANPNFLPLSCPNLLVEHSLQSINRHYELVAGPPLLKSQIRTSLLSYV